MNRLSRLSDPTGLFSRFIWKYETLDPKRNRILVSKYWQKHFVNIHWQAENGKRFRLFH